MSSPFIIAELGSSHNGNYGTARDLVIGACEAGADAVKLQTYNPEQMAIPEHHIEGTVWKGMNLRDLYREAMTPREWHEPLFEIIRGYGKVPMSTPFHPDDVAFLEKVGCERYKIASFEACYTDLLQAAANTGKPMYLSTGMINTREIEVIMDLLFGHRIQITLMHCVSDYPTLMGKANLPRIRMLQRYGPVGFSDHTRGINAAPLAVAIGASVIEKHIGLRDRGHDSEFAITVDQFRHMVLLCHEASATITPSHPSTQQPTRSLRRSVWCATAKKKGEVYTKDDLVVMRPWSGVSPFDYVDWLGKPASEDHGAWEMPR